MHFNKDVELSVIEVEEGSEPDEFWEWTSENDEPYYSLSNSKCYVVIYVFILKHFKPD